MLNTTRGQKGWFPQRYCKHKAELPHIPVVHFCFSESFQKWLNVHPVTDRLYRKFCGTSEASVRHEKVTASTFTAFRRLNTSKNKRHGQFDIVISFSFTCQAKNSRSGPE
ncbi:unnamed protein product [Ixodes pacificus]